MDRQVNVPLGDAGQVNLDEDVVVVLPERRPGATVGAGHGPAILAEEAVEERLQPVRGAVPGRGERRRRCELAGSIGISFQKFTGNG